MVIIENGGTIWGDQFAKIAAEYVELPVLYEIGAFDGHDVDLFLENIPETFAVAIEASPKSYDAYLKGKPYNTYNLAISNNTGKTKFFEKYDRVLSSVRDNGEPGEEIEVPCSRLDDFVRTMGLPAPNVVKIDTEGTTYEVLEGMGSLLPFVEVLYIETEDYPFWKNQKLHRDVKKLLKGFRCVLMHKNGLQRDSIWVSR